MKACCPEELAPKLRDPSMPDPTSQSNYLEITTEHIDITWSLDFNKKIVEGTAKHTLQAQKDGVQQVV